MDQVTVELDIFSGNQNPSWSVSSEQLSRRLSVMVPSNAKPAEVPSLGYRGLILHLKSGETMRVFGGHVSLNGVLFDDCNSELERWLLSLGKGLFADNLIDSIEQMLGDEN